MSTATATPTSTVGTPSVERKGNVFVKWITTTDHKTIGYLYLITSFIYFLIGGVLALKSETTPFPVQADVSSGSTRVQIAGTISQPFRRK